MKVNGRIQEKPPKVLRQLLLNQFAYLLKISVFMSFNIVLAVYQFYLYIVVLQAFVQSKAQFLPYKVSFYGVGRLPVTNASHIVSAIQFTTHNLHC